MIETAILIAAGVLWASLIILVTNPSLGVRFCLWARGARDVELPEDDEEKTSIDIEAQDAAD